jgi:hypothetical protein
MKLVFKLYPSLPSLSWAAEITADAALIHHGPGLEHGDDWLVDGCWPSRFEDGPPTNYVDGLFAFIVRADHNDLIIDCPTHPLERIFLLRNAAKIIASPSIPFVLALSGADVDPAYPDYMFDFVRAISRISENIGAMPLGGGRTLENIVNRRVTINERLETKIEYRPFERSFRSFEEYHEFLLQTLASLRDNAASPARRAGTFGLASTISAGYDSPMLCIMAKRLGLPDAITFQAPGDTADSGAHLAPYIGIDVHKIDRHAFQKQPGFPEVEFLATGARAEDVVLAGAADYFRNKAVISGIFAEVTDPQSKYTSPDIMRTNTVGCGMLEFRWRVGFQFLTVGHAGCMGMMSLKALSNRKEMLPWMLGGNYDRPFARRIIEGAGIPRGSFAKQKIGMISVKFDVSDDELKRVMNPHSHAALMAYIEREKSKRPLPARLKRIVKYGAYRAERAINRKLHDAGIADKIATSFDPRHQSIPAHSSYLAPWAIRVQKEIYARALAMPN